MKFINACSVIKSECEGIELEFKLHVTTKSDKCSLSLPFFVSIIHSFALSITLLNAYK